MPFELNRPSDGRGSLPIGVGYASLSLISCCEYVGVTLTHTALVDTRLGFVSLNLGHMAFANYSFFPDW